MGLHDAGAAAGGTTRAPQQKLRGTRGVVMLTLTLISSLLSLGAALAPGYCEQGYTLMALNGGESLCLRFVQSLKTHSAALSNCVGLSSEGTLATAVDQTELNFLYTMCGRPDKDCWIGAKDYGSPDNTWRWANGAYGSTPWIALPDPATFDFNLHSEIPWAVGEPDDGGLPWLTHNCGKTAFSVDPNTVTIQDDDCDSVFNFICQVPAKCNKGSYLQSGSCIECPKGRYSDIESISGMSATCQPCLPGRYGASTGMTDAQCTGECSPGHYCSGGETSPTQKQCAAGRYASSAGSVTSNCEGKCQAGWYCGTGETSKTPKSDVPGEEQMCNAGRFGNAGATTASCSGTCQRGYYCPPGSDKRTMRECGTDTTTYVRLGAEAYTKYCPTGSALPSTVPAYHYSSGGNQYTRYHANSCYQGRWCSGGISRNCAAGRWGKYQSQGANYDDDQCEGPCTAGYYCPAGSVAATQYECAYAHATSSYVSPQEEVYCPSNSGAPVTASPDYYTTPWNGNYNKVKTGQTLCIRDYACLHGWSDMKIEFYDGCTKHSGGSVGDRHFEGLTNVKENAVVDFHTIEVQVRKGQEPQEAVEWSVQAVCLAPATALNDDWSAFFGVTAVAGTTTTYYTPYILTVSTVAEVNYEACEAISVAVVGHITDKDPADTPREQYFTCDLYTRIEDDNDAPVFAQALYDRYTPELVKPQTAVGDRVVADDEDVGQDLLYEITSQDVPGLFGISLCGGQVYAKGDLDYEAVPNTFTVNIQVKDLPAIGVQKFATTTVEVHLTNVNEEPRFTYAPAANHSWQLAENGEWGVIVRRDLDPAEDQLYGIQAVDPDGDVLTYVLEVIDGSQTTPQFALKDGVGPELVSTSDLDYEATSRYRVVVRVEDQADPPLFVEMYDAVEVVDMNDPPVFTTTYTFDVVEDTTKDFTEMFITATDPDAGANIAMSITAGDDGSFSLLRQSSTEFLLKLVVALDFESTDPIYLSHTDVYGHYVKYRSITIRAQDDGVPPATAETVVNVTVINVNEAPSFTGTKQTQYVYEHSTVGTIQGVELNATDPEALFQTLVWSIDVSDVNVGLPFDIDATTGKLKIIADMDFEAPGGGDAYSVKVKVEDNGSPRYSDVGTVEVWLLNVNEPAVFNTSTLAFSIPENAANMSFVGQVQAVDPDVGDTATLLYWPCEGTEDKWEHFNMDTGGNIYTQASTQDVWLSQLNFEGTSTFRLCVKVNDTGGAEKDADVVVTLMDVNETPRFLGASFSRTIGDGEEIGVEVGAQLVAEDQDAGHTATLEWSMVEQDPQYAGEFAINSATGQVTAALVVGPCQVLAPPWTSSST